MNRWLPMIAGVVALATASLCRADSPKKYALLIGIDKYTSVSLIKKELKYARADAIGLKDALTRRGWESVAVVDEAADRGRIIRELYKLRLKAGPSDKVLVYFAGHGVRDPSGRGNTYWVTTDATVENLVSDGIRVSHIMEYIREIDAEEKIVILDHCYSGDFVTAGASASTSERNVSDNSTVAVNERELFPEEIESLANLTERSLVILAAARGPAYEDDDWKHGMFTKAILDILNSPQSDNDPRDGKISLDEFWADLNDRIEAMASARNLDQRPLSNATVNQLQWHMFSAAVEDFSAEAAELRNLLMQIEMLAGANLAIGIKQAVHNAIGDFEVSTAGGSDPEPLSVEIVRFLRMIRDEGVRPDSMQKLVQKAGELNLGGGA